MKRGFFFNKAGRLIIGDHFKCNSTISSNSIGVIQPVIINVASPNSQVLIGRNVGISGSTLNASKSITIGDNVLIGSGCIISDTDSHSLDPRFRDVQSRICSKPIVIESNAFIGARSIILKGVRVGEGAIVGAGSVVTRDVPAYSIVAGNPARFLKKIQIDQ